MTNLGQTEYEDDNGHPISAEKVDCLAPYTFICDGFYRWTCGRCGKRTCDRWYSPSGRVVKCEDGSPGFSGEDIDENMRGCGAMNLLVRTNCKEVAQVMSTKYEADERWKENERLRGIVKYNEDKIHEVAQRLVGAIDTAVHNLANSMKWDMQHPPKEEGNGSEKKTG